MNKSVAREQFVQWLGSFPVHDDDRGPDNVVLIDLLPAGNDFGETSLRRLATAIAVRLRSAEVRNEVLSEVLDFYSRPSNYERQWLCFREGFGDVFDPSPVEKDNHGGRARGALRQNEPPTTPTVAPHHEGTP